MDNKQMLERAAKAAGYKLFYWGDGTCMRMAEPYDIAWDPINNDADAFRLMVDCGVDAKASSDGALATTYSSDDDGLLVFAEYYDEHNNDKRAATRMAIVRAAARNARGPLCSRK